MTNYADYNPAGASRTTKTGTIRLIPNEPNYYNHKWFGAFMFDFLQKNILEKNGVISGCEITDGGSNSIDCSGGEIFINGIKYTISAQANFPTSEDGWYVAYAKTDLTVVYGKLLSNSVQGAITPDDSVLLGYAVRGQGVFNVFSIFNNVYFLEYIKYRIDNPQLLQLLDYYIDSGTSDNYILSVPSNDYRKPLKYFDGMRVFFYASDTNTGTSIINVENLGNKDLTLKGGINLSNGLIRSGQLISAIYNLSFDRFEINYNKQIYNNYKDDGSTGNSIILKSNSYSNFTPLIDYFDGLTVVFKSTINNDGPVTINIDNIGTKNLTMSNGDQVIANTLRIGQYQKVYYNSNEDRFEIHLQKIFYTYFEDNGSLGNNISLSSISLESHDPLIDYFDGLTVVFKSTINNDGPVTINIDNIGTKNVKYYDGSDLVAGTIQSGNYVTVVYNNNDDRFELLSYPKRVYSNFAVTGTSGWSTQRAFAIPYRISNKIFCDFYIYGITTNFSKSSLAISISGVTFPNMQAVTVAVNSVSVAATANTQSPNTIAVFHSSAATVNYAFQASVEIDSWPTWA